jgi:hypothetical protein
MIIVIGEERPYIFYMEPAALCCNLNFHSGTLNERAVVKLLAVKKIIHYVSLLINVNHPSCAPFYRVKTSFRSFK